MSGYKCIVFPCFLHRNQLSLQPIISNNCVEKGAILFDVVNIFSAIIGKGSVLTNIKKKPVWLGFFNFKYSKCK